MKIAAHTRRVHRAESGGSINFFNFELTSCCQRQSSRLFMVSNYSPNCFFSQPEAPGVRMRFSLSRSFSVTVLTRSDLSLNLGPKLIPCVRERAQRGRTKDRSGSGEACAICPFATLYPIIWSISGDYRRRQESSLHRK